jgi:hypothetical protein
VGHRTAVAVYEEATEGDTELHATTDDSQTIGKM